MNVKSEENSEQAETSPDQGHPAWCDRTRCTADPASQVEGYRSGVGGQHCSADLALNLRAGLWPIPPSAVVWMTEAVAPWRCSTYLRIELAGGAEISMPVESAAPVLAALSGLVASALEDWEAGS